tara:strand:- start:924 stop:1760 length:837 start_codon:yes stop_codon:yes gene_type:complete
MLKNTQTTGLNRDTIDKYYTNQDTVTNCIKKIKQHTQINEDDLFIEPSAGNGSFIPKLLSLSSNCLFYDIEPENSSIMKQDYLLLDTDNITKNYNKVHVVGNPPFGRQSSLAIKFIKKSSEFCDYISFILPKSFKKKSMQKHFPLDFHLLFEEDIQDDGFLVNDTVYNVPCVFQIWEKRNVKREPEVKVLPIGFSFVKKNENPDIAFRRVGVYAGRIYNDDISNKSEQSHYFIKFDKKISETVHQQLNTISFDKKNDTVGPRSISKQELIQIYNTITF